MNSCRFISIVPRRERPGRPCLEPAFNSESTPQFGEWEVEDPVRRAVLTLIKVVGRHHRPGQRVVTQWLDFQSVVAKPGRKVAAAVGLVGVNVEPTDREEKAEAKVVGSHRWMRTSPECVCERPTEGTSDKSLGACVIEKEVREASGSAC